MAVPTVKVVFAACLVLASAACGGSPGSADAAPMDAPSVDGIGGADAASDATLDSGPTPPDADAPDSEMADAGAVDAAVADAADLDATPPTDADTSDASADTGVDACAPSCGPRTCGDDGCGGSCGSCGATQTCDTGACEEICGDALVRAPETCDDGNLVALDGCDATCAVEAGFRCSGEPSTCMHTPGAGEVVFTELMFDPGLVTDPLGEWVELQNVSTLDLDLSDCVFTDGEGSYSIPLGTTLGAGARLTLASSASPGFTPDLSWSGAGIALANSGDDVYLTCGTTDVDQVLALTSAGWPVAMSGISYSLSPLLTDAISNDAFASWCRSFTAYAGGDRGTPGLANDPCL